MRLNRLDGAIADFTRLISMRPAEARGYWRRGEALVRVGKHAEALRDLDRALALGADETGAANFARGQAQEALGDLDGARASYDTAIERNPGNVACRVRRWQVNNEQENWQGCLVDTEALLVHAPNHPPLVLSLARLCARTGRRDDAMAAYDRLIALEPANADAYHERSELWRQRDDRDAARADLARAFELAPNDPDIRMDYGRNECLFAQNDEDRAAARQIIASSVDLDKENPQVWATAGHRLSQCGHPEEAIPFLTRAVELDPENPEYLSGRATCIEGAAPPVHADPDGHRAAHLAALEDIERAMELSEEDDLELYRDRARLREEIGDLEGALADQTKMMDLFPDFIDAYADRARLRKRLGDMDGARADAAKVTEREEELIAEHAKYFPGQDFNLQRFNLDKE
jgi:tetratricopeptide (TPR) repeat protein